MPSAKQRLAHWSNLYHFEHYATECLNCLSIFLKAIVSGTESTTTANTTTTAG